MARGTVEEGEYAGHPAVGLRAGPYRLHVATGFGPRIIGFEIEDSGNLFAVLPDAYLPAGDGRRYWFRGGHRLWLAPEDPPITYRPDDAPVETEPIDGGLAVTGPGDPVTGFRKRIEIRAGGDELVVRHVLRNEGSTTTRVAPWGITQVPLGGAGWLPLHVPGRDGSSPQPDRLLVLWPYTNLDDPRLQLAEDHVRIEASRRDGDAQRLKVGAAGAGWLAYLRDGWLFEKTTEPGPPEVTPDLGAGAQIYGDDRFMELETLGVLADLGPGDEAVHVERWRVGRATEADLERRSGGG